MSAETLLGLVAAFCTTISYLPQVIKAWKTGSTADLSMQMMLLLFAGLSLWIAYGFMKADHVIVVANSISLVMLANLIFLKTREYLAAKQAGASQQSGAQQETAAGWRKSDRRDAPKLAAPG